MSADEQLPVRLEARINDFEKQMKKAEITGTRTYQNLRRGSRSATRGMEQDMARSASSIRQSVASVGGSIGSLGKALVGGLAVGAASEFARSSRQVVRGIAEIGNEAKRAGLSAQAFQEWSFVADQNRISVDALTDGFKELSLREDEFISTGAGPAAEAFTRMSF